MAASPNPANSATVTAKTGPGKQATALVLTGVTAYNFDVASGILWVSQGSVQNQFQLTGSNTITFTASSGLYTLTVA